MALRDLLRPMRDQAGLTQRALAVRLGVTATAISRWETGDRAIDLDTAEKWADACGVRLGVDGATPIQHVGLAEHDINILMRLLRLLPRLHPVAREDLEHLLDRWEQRNAGD